MGWQILLTLELLRLHLSYEEVFHAYCKDSEMDAGNQGPSRGKRQEALLRPRQRALRLFRTFQ